MTAANILIVEDKAIIAKDIQANLEDAGYNVVGLATTGNGAITKAKELKPDLILMDIRLKGNIDGIEAASVIRADHNVPIIFLTAHADQETLDRAVVTEPYGYILKPFEEKELRVAVQMTLYKYNIEKKLKTQQHWLAATLESIGDAVITTNPQGKIIYMNPVAKDLTNWNHKKGEGLDINEVMNFIDEDSRAPVTNPLVNALATGSPSGFKSPTLLVLEDGREIPIDDIACPIRDQSGDIIGGVIVFRNVQHARMIEEQLRQSQKLEAVGQLAAGVAHNFNNMLTSISLYTGIVSSSMNPGSSNYERLGLVQETVERAASMVNNLLAFTHRQTIWPETLSMNEEIWKTSELLTGMLPASISLNITPLAQFDSVKMDPNQFKQVMLNMILNARDAMPAGGRIQVRTKNMDFIEHKISLPVGVSPGNYFVIEIGDEGKGIVKEVLDRIFEPFFTTKSPGEGTGLGLSTCLGIIEQHQGHITVDTVVGEGSIFRIFLPLYQPNLPAVAGSGHTAEPDRSSNSILVVEDNDSIREAIVLSLKSRGYAVHQSKNGREALELIKSNTAAPFSLLITDLMMPEMGGKALASFVKMVQYNLKTLFISGFSDSDNMPVGSEFLAKPFSTEQLFAKVADLLEK